MLVLLSTAFMLGLNGCAPKSTTDWENLKLIEIKDYEGEDLSSVVDFVENSINGPQYVDITDYRLLVDGLVNNQMALSYDVILNEYSNEKRLVRLDCVEGWGVTILWEGFPIRELIQQADPAADVNTVIFHCADGYTTSSPLAYLLENDILIAHKINGVTLPPERGYPLMLVAQEKWGYKWAKWITKIEFTNDPDYRGYWESRGFSNLGDRDKSFVGP